MENWGGTVRVLMLECASGISPACDEVFDYLGPVFLRVAGRVARQFGVNSDIADIVQEINLKVIKGKTELARCLPEAPLAVQSYFYVLAANTARDSFRKDRRQRTVVLDEVLEAIRTECHVDDGLDRDVLIEQIENAIPLNDRHRTIFRLHYRQGFSAREIAAIPAIGLSVKGVEAVLLRLRSQLKEKLAPAKYEGKSRSAAS